MSGYQILDLAAIEPVPYHAREGEKLLPIQRLTGFRAAGVNGWTGEPGEKLVPEHDEDSGHEELYVVVRGRATFTVDGNAFDAPAGTLVHLLAGELRAAVAEEPGTIVIAVGATPGEAYVVQGWTSFAVADALRRGGRLGEARVVMQEMLELAPGQWGAPYNVACFEALEGEIDAAFRYLEQAVEIDAQAVRDFAPNDSDLDALHDDPRWRSVIG